MKLVLDTCALVWVIAEPERLTKVAREKLLAPDSEILVSAISCAEIACGVERKRIVLDRHWKKWFRYFTELNGWTVAGVDLSVIEEAYSLPDKFQTDPADRIIVATARLNDAAVVTSDRRMLEYPHVESCW